MTAALYREAYYSDEKPRYLTHAAEDSEWANLFWNDRLEIFEAHTSLRRVLDIGCGPGWFLKAAKDRGWAPLGIDPSRQACEHVRTLGVDVIEGEFTPELARSIGLFSAVHINNVLEHVQSPADFIQRAKSVLIPGGIICVCVPNDNSPFQIAASEQAGKWWIDPHHLNYFSFASLSKLLIDLGFIEIARTTSFPMEMFLLMGMDYTKDQALGRKCHGQRKRFDMALDTETRRTFYAALAKAGLGREVVIIARKPKGTMHADDCGFHLHRNPEECNCEKAG